MRGVKGASDLVGFTVEGMYFQTIEAAMSEKLWFSKNRGTKMTKNGNFCIVLQCVGTNSGWFLTEPHRV